MFRKKSPPIRIGDHFVKTGGTRKVWTVIDIANAHARLVSRQLSPEHITISVRALADRSLFQPIAADAAEERSEGF
jgi:hypothetical protein